MLGSVAGRSFSEEARPMGKRPHTEEQIISD
jgi:hypothetical protein